MRERMVKAGDYFEISPPPDYTGDIKGLVGKALSPLFGEIGEIITVEITGLRRVVTEGDA